MSAATPLARGAGRTSLSRVLLLLSVSLSIWSCATSRPPAPVPETSRGVASWYGEEFAGRPTANGEIFDPRLLTAAHRTLPFGTILDVRNAKTNQTVRVRVNDRGPYIGNRVIDLSWAAAEKIGLIEPGIGEVEIHIVRLGGGEREAPVPLEVTIQEPPAVEEGPPEVAFPLPPTAAPPAVVDRVEVETQRDGVVTRRRVAEDGQTVESVPVNPPPAPRANPAASTTRGARGAFHVQVGAFAVEENARALRDRLLAAGEKAWVEATDLFRVRLGPFVTREEAVAVRSRLESLGVSAMIVTD